MNTTMAKAQVREKMFSTVEGIIIYPSAETLPTEVILIPVKIDTTKSLTGNLLFHFKQLPQINYLVFFRGIRWIEPDVADRLQQCQFQTAAITNFYDFNADVRITVGRIVFDLTWKDGLIPLKEYKPLDCVLTWNNHVITIAVQEAPNDFGVPYRFDGNIKFPQSK
jgi:hypothetical protein